jgi:hypothetical protein
MFTSSKNLPQNYAYEKYKDSAFFDYKQSPEGNYPPIMYYAGQGLGNYTIRDPSILHANGTDIESYLRGTGSKALERRDTPVDPSPKRVMGTLHLDTERMAAKRSSVQYMPRNTRITPYGIENVQFGFPQQKNHERPSIR